MNVLSAALGALLIAVLGQFSLALSARYLERRGTGLAAGEALRGAYAGAAETVVAPAVVAVAGFLALAVSDVHESRSTATAPIVMTARARFMVILSGPTVVRQGA